MIPLLRPQDFHYVLQDFYTIFIQNGKYSVDSFFFLSGFLGTFSLWRSISLQFLAYRPLVYIPMSYLTRFLRLAPMMMFVTMIVSEIHGISRNDVDTCSFREHLHWEKWRRNCPSSIDISMLLSHLKICSQKTWKSFFASTSQDVKLRLKFLMNKKREICYSKHMVEINTKEHSLFSFIYFYLHSGGPAAFPDYWDGFSICLTTNLYFASLRKSFPSKVLSNWTSNPDPIGLNAVLGSCLPVQPNLEFSLSWWSHSTSWNTKWLPRR